jgi:hypothetical protein
MSQQEITCLDLCVKNLHKSHERTIEYFREFERKESDKVKTEAVKAEQEKVEQVKKEEVAKIMERK